MDAPRALVFRPLVKGKDALGTRLAQVSLGERKASPPSPSVSERRRRRRRRLKFWPSQFACGSCPTKKA